MENNYAKRLIEVDMPIRRISAHARREKSIRHGHISTLHIWWARRPLAACRAVLCAALWFDPCDPDCPAAFRGLARETMRDLAQNNLRMFGAESLQDFSDASRNPSLLVEDEFLRQLLLDFIADFANWDNSTNPDFLNAARFLTHVAHLTLTENLEFQEAFAEYENDHQIEKLKSKIESLPKPLVVDPFAGGGAIPLEALRVGADAFASDLNPIAVMLNKMLLERLPCYRDTLATDIRKWGAWVKQEAEKELAEFYPTSADGAAPIIYLWGRTVTCEGPNCGATFPLIRQPLISRDCDGRKSIVFGDAGIGKPVDIFVKDVEDDLGVSTCRGFVAICPRRTCGYTTKKKSVQAQLTESQGGADNATLLAVVSSKDGKRYYNLPTDVDFEALNKSSNFFEKLVKENGDDFALNEPIPSKEAHRAVGSQLPLYGFRSWGDLFTTRQKVALFTLQKAVRKAYTEILKSHDEAYGKAIFTLLAFAIDKQADYSSSLCRWVYDEGFVAATLGGEKKFPMLSDFAECNPIGTGSGSWGNQIDWIAKFLERESSVFSEVGTAVQSSANNQVLPDDAASALITDPPYYDSVPYSDLSDYFYVWLRRTLKGIEQIQQEQLTPKELEMTVNHPKNDEEKKRYETLLTSAFGVAQRAVNSAGIGVIVFAHKSTAGWEALLEAIIKSGWIVTASWAIDTERTSRPNALGTASLGSSIHLVCRPRLSKAVGDYGQVLLELPRRINEWLPRLASEGIVGADAIFACLGPALEIFSRYERVERTNGETVGLREYLELVWAAVAKEALSMIFAGADASGFEPDARITAMWLWTLSTARDRTDLESRVINAMNPDEEETETDADDDEEETGGKKKVKGFVLEYDAARKIAQGLGVNLDAMEICEVKGETARLLPVKERARQLFGSPADETATATAATRGRRKVQQSLFGEMEEAITATVSGWHLADESRRGATVLDRLHQAMIFFAAGRGEALRRFLVDEGVGADERFWRLANALSALYPKTSEEKRWVDGILAKKKGLGF